MNDKEQTSRRFGESGEGELREVEAMDEGTAIGKAFSGDWQMQSFGFGMFSDPDTLYLKAFYPDGIYWAATTGSNSARTLRSISTPAFVSVLRSSVVLSGVPTSWGDGRRLARSMLGLAKCTCSCLACSWAH